MMGMLLYYVCSIVFLAIGAGAVVLEGSALLLGSAFSLPQLLLYGAAPLGIGGLALQRGRFLRRRIEAHHREQFLLALAKQQGGLLDAPETAKRLDLPLREAQRLLESAARSGLADMKVADDGQTYFQFDERRLLGA